MARLPKSLWLVGCKSACDLDLYLGVFVSLELARGLFMSLAQTDKTAFLVCVKLQV